ncbi:MAG: hypothetical protein JRF61_20310 [Deltaproteobacteria bacterium]|nr:hypothetical protein [Deltaproteobacteria bacterium]
MTIQDLGSIGELLAAIATIATLVYLARQLRANTKAIQSDARRSFRAAGAGALLAIASDTQVAAIFDAGLRDFGGLPRDQRTQFTFLISDMVGNWQIMYEEFESGVLDPRKLDEYGNAYVPIVSSPGGREWWTRYRDRYPASFQDHVNAKIGSVSHS